MTTTVEAGEFRIGQRAQWNTAASGWKKWSPLIDKGAGPVGERLVELAHIRPGDRVLDVATGYGEPALTAARRVGPEGEVVATDISAEMLAFGRERAAAAGLENVRFLETDAASLDFPPESFDAALSRWGIIFEPEPEATVARIRGFLKHGARMAIASWGPIDRAPMFDLTMGTLVRRLEIPPPPPGTPGPLARPTREAVEALLAHGGFSNVEVEEIEVLFDYESPAEFVTCLREIAPPITALLSQYPEDVRQEGWAAITAAARERAGGDRPFQLSNLALLAVGEA
ncbi:MAG TPA: methyltransferase domain-containing protein [Thermoleophilaceae bacterium]|nr:methyltransferase domain-containing protein [Thermoleophilaceae bacterium]